MDEIKQEILEWLKRLGRLATSRVMGLIGRDYKSTLKLLEELSQEGKIIKEEETNAVYWCLFNKDNNKEKK